MPPQPKTFDRVDLVRFFHDAGPGASVGAFHIVTPSRTLFGVTESTRCAVEAETLALWCEPYKLAIVIQQVHFPDGGSNYFAADHPLRQPRRVTIRYGDGGSSANLVRWVMELADTFRAEIKAAVPVDPIDLTVRHEPVAIAPAVVDPEPEPDPESDPADEDHGRTGTTMDDLLDSLDGGEVE